MGWQSFLNYDKYNSSTSNTSMDADLMYLIVVPPDAKGKMGVVSAVSLIKGIQIRLRASRGMQNWKFAADENGKNQRDVLRKCK